MPVYPPHSIQCHHPPDRRPGAEHVSAPAAVNRRVGRGARAGHRAADEPPRLRGPRHIAVFYKARWQIALFFKALQRNLRVKSFVGTTENALRIQIWTALLALLLLKMAAPPVESGVVALQSCVHAAPQPLYLPPLTRLYPSFPNGVTT